MKRSLILLLICLALPTMALAAKHGPAGGDAFDRADKDGDGMLNRDEARAVGIMNWHQMVCDTDSDMLISKSEYAACKDSLKSPAPVEPHAKAQ